MEDKPPWEKPQLIVLVRSEPEEMVLQACKTNRRLTNGPRGFDNDGCFYSGYACSQLVSS